MLFCATGCHATLSKWTKVPKRRSKTGARENTNGEHDLGPRDDGSGGALRESCRNRLQGRLPIAECIIDPREWSVFLPLFKVLNQPRLLYTLHKNDASATACK